MIQLLTMVLLLIIWIDLATYLRQIKKLIQETNEYLRIEVEVFKEEEKD